MQEASTEQGDNAISGGRLRAIILGLQCKSTVLVVGVTLSVAALVGGLFFRLSGQVTSRLQTEHSVRLCALLARSAAHGVAESDHGALRKLARQFATGDPLLFVAFTDPAGNLITSSDTQGHPVGPDLMPRPVIDRTAVGRAVHRPGRDGRPTYFDVTYPIETLESEPDSTPPGRSDLIGYVRLGFNLSPTLRAYSSVMDLVSGMATAVVLIAVPLAFLVVRRIVVPLNELSRVAGRLARGDLGARSAIRRTDEIGQLADAFNAMAGEIERSSREILSMNATLEQRVRQRTRQLRELATRDPLTGLHNRRHFSEVLTRRFAEAQRYGTPLSCLMIDLDNFKEVNDRCGHQTGDEVLVLVAVTIASELRAADVAARFGGDEFIVLLPHTASDQAQFLSKRIVDKLAASLLQQYPHVTVSMSVGVASLLPDGVPDPEALIRDADRALYEAKKSGKNRIEISRVAV